MNYLSIDYGTKRIGLAYAFDGFISTLPAIKNDSSVFTEITSVIKKYSIGRVFVGVSEGDFAVKTRNFVSKLQEKVDVPVETVEEAVSTIEADEIFKDNQKKSKDYKKKIDSIAAAVILRRVISL